MKYILVTTAILVLAGCNDETSNAKSESGRTYKVECIDGVEYWIRAGGNRGYMAVRVDPKTMSFVRCNTN